MLTGPNYQAQEAMLAVGKFNVIASGGVSRREDVIELSKLAKRHPRLEGVIVGKAIYEKRVDLRDLLDLAAKA
jgi:phosphoribosylformimino-5-aminoimidazole carboxamide ribotide isomerase